MTPHIYKYISQKEGLLYAWFPAMHTRVDLVLYSNQTRDDLLFIIEAVRREVQRWEAIGNCFDTGSELAAVNRQAALAPMPISEELYDVLAFCKEYHQKTYGYFDVTIDSEQHNPETMKEVCLSREQRTIFFRNEGIRINLSGMIKGWALDKLRILLQAKGIENVLLNLGNSSVIALGHSPTNKEGWKVSLKDKSAANMLRNECLTTSGNETATRKHIVSPYSGEFIEGIAQVTVVTQSGALGEVLSTSLFAAKASDMQDKINHRLAPSAIYWQT